MCVAAGMQLIVAIHCINNSWFIIIEDEDTSGSLPFDVDAKCRIRTADGLSLIKSFGTGFAYPTRTSDGLQINVTKGIELSKKLEQEGTQAGTSNFVYLIKEIKLNRIY